MNLIPMIVKELGVEVGEEFGIREVENCNTEMFRYKYRFTQTELQFKSGNYWVHTTIPTSLLTGQAEIKKLPFEPKEGGIYWSVAWSETPHLIAVCNLHWHSNDKCYADKYAGNCFRTNAEAEKHKYEIYKKLTGRKWEEKCED